MVDQHFEFDEVLRILLGMLVDVQKCLVEDCSGFIDRYDVVNVGKGSRPDGCFCQRMMASVRHRCLDDMAATKIDEGMSAWASECSTSISKIPELSTTSIVRRGIGSLITTRHRETLHGGEATQVRIFYQTRRQVAVDKAARRKTAEEKSSN